MTLLSVENLRIMDVWTHTTLVEEVNFKVTQGETLGMIERAVAVNLLRVKLY